MNKIRRKQLASLSTRVEALKSKLELLNELNAEVADIISELETVRDEEVEYMENMPESLHGGEKHSAAEQAVDAMNSAIDSLQEVNDACETLQTFDADAVIGNLDEAEHV